MAGYRDVAPTQVQSWIQADPDSIFLLDVREPFEYEICRIQGSRLIPLSRLGASLDQIPRDVRVVCICHHGGRSAHACAVLAQRGFERLYNLDGGVDRWALEIDPGMERY